jgi:hypothetical protein
MIRLEEVRLRKKGRKKEKERKERKSLSRLHLDFTPFLFHSS